MNTKTLSLVTHANDILDRYEGQITLRGLFYRLVAELVVENTPESYNRVMYAVKIGRQEGILDDERFTDRMRAVVAVNGWGDPNEFLHTVGEQYHRDRRATQEAHLELWLEKDTLRSIVRPVTDAFDVTLVVGRGYFSRTSTYQAAKRFAEWGGPGVILYLGDLDPSGEDIPRNLVAQLTEHGVSVNLEKLALTPEQVAEYDCPTMATKPSDKRTKRYRETFGDVAVELDALAPDVLREIVHEGIERHTDLDLFAHEAGAVEYERSRVIAALSRVEVAA